MGGASGPLKGMYRHPPPACETTKPGTLSAALAMTRKSGRPSPVTSATETGPAVRNRTVSGLAANWSEGGAKAARGVQWPAR